MFGVVQPPAEAHHTLDLLVPQRAMSGGALEVVEFGVVGDSTWPIARARTYVSAEGAHEKCG
jgi:hypothetical protein